MYSRPRKLSHPDTIQYEIDMLNYCYNRVTKGWKNDVEGFLSLEGFLLHYRNLIEFFADHGNLKVSKCEVWVPKGMTVNKAEITSLKTTKPYKRHRALISQYLQHCTETRIKDHEWDVEGMYGEVKEVLTKFRNLFPVRRVARPVRVMSPDAKLIASYSTATITTSECGFAGETAHAKDAKSKDRGSK